MIISAILLVMVLAVPALAGTVIPDDTGNASPGFIAAADGAGIFVTDSESGSSSGLADTPWPKFGGDLNNSGLAPYVGTQSTTPKWEYDPVGGSGFKYSTPVIGSDGTIYIGTVDWRFYAFNPDGTAKWIYNDAGAYVTGGPIYGSAAIGSDGTIYFGTMSGETKLYALNSDGTLKWGSPTIGGITGSPAIGSDGTVYAGSDQIYAFNPVDGTIKWSYPAGVSYACPAIGADGTIYVGSSDANVYALNPDGTLKWNFTTGGEIQGSPAIGADGTIYIGNYGDNNVYALNPDGTLKWNFDAGGSIQGSPAIGSDGTIYIGTYGNNKVYALNPDGTQKWVYSLTNKVCGSLVIGADGTIYFVNKSRYLYALNPDGTLKFQSARLPTGSSPLGTPAIGPDGTVYFGTSDTYAKFYAFPGVVTGTADTTTGTAPLDVQFTGTSPLTVTSWHWDFGDGTTSTEQNPAHTYSSAGTYTVNLTVTHADGANYLRQTEYIKAYAPPTAGFTASVTSGLFPLAVSFTDQSTGSPTSWAWDFENDGIVDSTEQNPEHTYTAAGTYTVNLTATNAAGSDAEVKTDYITVSAPAIPRVSFTASHRVGIAPLTIRFADTSSSDPTSWLWDFGDGNTSTEQNPAHTYTATGKYNVSLTATNAYGSNATTQADYIVMTGTEVAPLPAGQSLNLYVANDEGVKYNVENGVTNTARYTPYVFIDNTYHFLYDGQGGGTNALHVSNAPSDTTGQVTTTTNQSGEFWFTFTGGQPNLHDAVLLLAVNGTIPDDFSVRIRSSGYDFEPPIPSVGNNNTISDPVYVDGAINQTFTKEDFIYGPQIWRPHRVSDYPVFVGQDMSDTGNTFELMFIDLRLGCTQTKSDGVVRVEYEFNNLTSFAVFNGYGWYSASNHGTGIIMTTSGSEYQVVGESGSGGDAPVANFTANVTSGDAPLAVQFTDASTGSPTSWAWDFENDGVVDSTEQSLVHTYTAAGTYTVNLTVANAGGSNSAVKTDCITVTEPTGPSVLPGYNNIFVKVANDLGAKYNSFDNNTYNIRFEGIGRGLNALHISTDPAVNFGQATVTENQSGTFYATDSGGKGYEDEIILMVAVNGTIPDDFRLRITADGYTWTPNPASNQPPSLDNVTYQASSLDEVFTKEDFIYGPQIWKPTGNEADYPIYAGQNMTDTENTFQIMFIDLNAGVLRPNEALDNQGAVRINYAFENLESFAAFSVYGYCKISNNGDDMVAWTNALTSDKAMSGYSVAGVPYTPPSAPVADFTATPLSGDAPLAVAFTDASTGTPTSWAWDFENDGTIDSTEQNPSHTYTAAGNYTVNLTVTNAAGSNSTIKADYITVTAPATFPDLTVSTLAPNCGEVFSASENTYTAKITNIGTADAGAFAVGFNVSGVAGTVAVTNGLAAGANATVTWTDETVRTAGENVTVTATADADGAIAESNEENNARTIEKTVVANGYRGKRWTGGDDLNTVKTYDVRGDLLWSAGDSAYLSAATNWIDYTVNWTAGDLAVPENATIAAARLYVPYTEDKGPVFPANVALTFNDVAVEQAAAYEDEKMWGSTYPYGMTVYDVAGQFSKDGNAAVLANAYPGGGNVSVRGMLLAVVYDDGTAAPHTVLINEGFDLLYGGASQGSTPEQATAYAPFAAVESGATGARLITVAPGAGPSEGDLLFNGETWTNVWNYAGTSQIGVDERNVTSFLAGENLAGFRSDADYMEAAAVFLVVEYPLPTGSIAVTSTPTGAAVFLDGTETGLATPITLENVPAGDHVVTLKLDGYADASVPLTVISDETATVDLTLTTLTGSLAVTSTPEGARILIDGAETGNVTNATLDGIAVGTHTVTVTKEGYRDASAEVTIAYNETAPLHLDLARAAGSIAVASTPDGARIYLNGTDTGRTTNATLENVPVGDHTVTVKKAGYADASTTVTVADNETAAVSFALAAPAGSIVVTSSPDGAAIFLDGVDTGEVTNATLTNVPVGTHTVRVELEGYQAAEETVTVKVDEVAEAAFTLDTSAITLRPGWNFISTPKRLADGQDTVAIFDEVDTADHSVLLYDGQDYKWRALSSTAAFQPLDGIWIYANTSYTIPLTFAAGEPELPPTKDLGAGWNAIGFTDTVPESAATTLISVSDAWTTLFGFDAEMQEYDVSIIRGAAGRHGDERTMQPMQGYWIYMTTADTLAAI